MAIQNSIENLVTKDLAIAYGYKTAKKWTVDKVKLTSKGKQSVKDIIKQRQGKLPIK